MRAPCRAGSARGSTRSPPSWGRRRAAGRVRAAAGTGRPSASSLRRAPGRSCRRPRAGRTRPRSRRRARRGRRRARRRSRASRRSGWIPVTTATPTIPIPRPERARAAQPLVREELQCDQRVEDRHRRLHDGGEAGVDVLLAPGDQPERDGRVEGAEDQEVAPGGAYLGRACAPSRSARRRSVISTAAARSVAHRHHRRGRDLVDGDLDEEVGRSPDSREEDQHRRVAIHLFTLPVPSATPASTSARPAMLSAVTFSSRKTAP